MDCEMQGSNTSDVQGQVTRWNHDKGVDQLDAQTYIEMLEREVEILRQELADNEEVCSRIHVYVVPCVCVNGILVLCATHGRHTPDGDWCTPWYVHLSAFAIDGGGHVQEDREDDDVSGGNEVLAYLRQHSQTHGQHVRPGREVREAMDVFLKRLLLSLIHISDPTRPY